MIVVMHDRIIRIAIVATVAIAPWSQAQDPEPYTEASLHPLLSNGFSADVGVFFPRRTLALSVDGTITGEHIEIEYDKAFGLGNADETTAVELAWRFGEKWSFLGQYFKSTYGKTKVLNEDIEWEDIVFGAGSSVTFSGGFQLTRFFVGRQFATDLRHNLGVGGGIHWLDIGSAIEGTAIVNGAPMTERRSARIEGPLPNIGAWYKYSITPRWAFRSRLDLFSASIDRYDGYLINAGAGVNYQAWEHIGFGLSYNYFELDVDVDKTEWRGDIETIYRGLFVSVTAFF